MEISNKNNTIRKKGEIDNILKDMKLEGEAMMRNLIEIDNLLITLDEKNKSDNVDKEEISDLIKFIRLKIGILEKEDQTEENFEEMADNLLLRLKRWMDDII